MPFTTEDLDSGPAGDAVTKSALTWLQKQTGCRS